MNATGRRGRAHQDTRSKSKARCSRSAVRPKRGKSAKAASRKQPLKRHSVRSGLAFVALGANLGDTLRNVVRAMERLAQLSSVPLLKSSLWETSPLDCPPGSPRFVNAVVGIVPRLGETPETLLRQLQALEREFGRPARHAHNAPRPLDLDVITFGEERRSTARLTLPHPRAHERRFVLEPFNELAPDLVLPGQTKTVKQLLADAVALGGQGRCIRLSKKAVAAGKGRRRAVE
jgi:2-amino-4-hydroxy-6-hydroxymethyldihydropteridine diphosphokinase